MILKLIIFILFFISTDPFFANGKEDKMFEVSNITEWGGISIDFSHEMSAKTFTIQKDEKIIKITEKNKKGAFPYNSIESLQYKTIDDTKGTFSVSFKKDSEANWEPMTFGIVTKDQWIRIKGNISSEINVQED